MDYVTVNRFLKQFKALLAVILFCFTAIATFIVVIASKEEGVITKLEDLYKITITVISSANNTHSSLTNKSVFV